MATAMWRMNGPQGKMSVAPLLLVGALLLIDGVMCDDPALSTVIPSLSSDPVTGAVSTLVPENAGTQAGTGMTSVEVVTMTHHAVPSVDNLGVMTTGQTGAVLPDATNTPTVAVADPETAAPLQLVLPVVNCKNMEAISGEEHVNAVVKTSTCEETKDILEAAPAAWCSAEYCRLDVAQDGNNILVASPDATSSNIEAALLSGNVKERLGVSEVKQSSSLPGASVFVGVLLTGLLLAAGLIGGYCFKNRRTTGDKGIRLAEESYPVDGDNQGNTLVSVAPLNPPPENQEPAETTEIPEPKEPAEIPEKPSANGEAPEEVKVDPPPAPTNGHSTAAKTADTEL